MYRLDIHIIHVYYTLMDFDEPEDIEDAQVLLPAEEVLINSLKSGLSFPEAALSAFPLKDDPVQYAKYRLNKNDLYRSCVTAYADKRYSDFEIIDKYAEIIQSTDDDAPVQLKALKDYHEFKKSFTTDPKHLSPELDGTSVVNQQIVNNFFENPSPHAKIPSVLIPKEQIYDEIPQRQDARQLGPQGSEGNAGNSPEANQE
jgi:hypothetical protein